MSDNIKKDSRSNFDHIEIGRDPILVGRTPIDLVKGPRIGTGYAPIRVGREAIMERAQPNRTKVEITLTPDPVVATGGGGGGCFSDAFRRIVNFDTDKTGISGGLITVVGIDNHEIPNHEINLKQFGEWLMYIELSYVVNRDDDNVIFLQGFESSTKPTGDWEDEPWSESASYPSDTPPLLASGIGKTILPLGRLKVVKSKDAEGNDDPSIDGVATFTPSGCGNFTVSHCAGIVSYARAGGTNEIEFS
jgi:hypothetical protein